jgi:hypothetical protein
MQCCSSCCRCPAARRPDGKRGCGGMRPPTSIPSRLTDARSIHQQPHPPAVSGSLLVRSADSCIQPPTLLRWAVQLAQKGSTEAQVLRIRGKICSVNPLRHRAEHGSQPIDGHITSSRPPSGIIAAEIMGISSVDALESSMAAPSPSLAARILDHQMDHAPLPTFLLDGCDSIVIGQFARSVRSPWQSRGIPALVRRRDHLFGVRAGRGRNYCNSALSPPDLSLETSTFISIGDPWWPFRLHRSVSVA